MKHSLIPALPFLVLACAGKETSPSGEISLVSRGTIDVPAPAPEIVSLSADLRILVHSDAVAHSLEIYRCQLATEGDARLEPVDFDSAKPGIQGVAFEFEPTSVTVHRTLPMALVTVIGSATTERGSLHAIDLRPETMGQTLWVEPLGCHPDSLAISPDGRFAVVANEGEVGGNKTDAPGTVSVLHLSGLDAISGARPTAGLLNEELEVHSGIAQRAQDCEPEFVGMDPKSRFAIVTLQENDAAVVIDLRGERARRMDCVLNLPAGAEPDGCALFDGYVDPKFGAGVLVAFAEEGRQKVDGTWLGQALSLYWFGPTGPKAGEERFEFLGRADVASDLKRMGEELSPEAVVIFRHGTRLLAAVSVERDNSVLLYDLADPRAPRFMARCGVGVRPEGLCAVVEAGRTFLITGDEGKNGPGQVSVVEVVSAP